ncbi:lysozyme inhibitor LprI family protein [Vibrio sp. Of7-15]|uniref:lysozyme inhibitor LprI family protein n=1 Tax=Vibrio sp. Of7-15 TaxID=2724879 RepID=UPI001EF3B450|nr:lysozyme inhibitor LprI family protein [Vibrio sp. Of7-15]MCG7498061.1 lysozyme inhibitor LprI family protein [Vibrio sp. Of7-15]
MKKWLNLQSQYFIRETKLKKSQWILSCSMLTFGLLPFNINAASFDCEKAQTKVEKLICKDKDLGVLDEMLNRQYKAQREVFDNADWVKARQLEWLARRDQVCTNIYSCMDTYYARIADLKHYNVGDSKDTGRQFMGQKPPVESHMTFFDFKNHTLVMNFQKGTTHSIEVIRKSDNEVTQVIDLGGDTDNLYYGTTREYLSMPDVNDDGYADIMLLSSWGARGGTESYEVWTYNPESQDYEYTSGIGAR